MKSKNHLDKLKNKRSTSKKSFSNKKIRLNKFIANTGICSRREADKFIEAGVVTVNGKSITKMGSLISLTDVIRFNNEILKTDTSRYILLNKPKNYSLSNSKKEKTIKHLLKNACKEEIYPIDKLHKTESGLLLLTNDYDLLKKLSKKNQKIKVIYQITLNKKLTQKDLDIIKNETVKNFGGNLITNISYITNEEKNVIGIETKKGATNFIKKRFEKLDYTITGLDRVFIAGLTKKNLPRKHYRHLSKKEISILKRL